MSNEQNEKPVSPLIHFCFLAGTLGVVLGCGRASNPAATPPQGALESTPAAPDESADGEVAVYEVSAPPVDESSAPAEPVPSAPWLPKSELRDTDDPLVGTWIGKWDGMYTIMFLIRKNEDRYDLVYKWEEQIGHPFLREACQMIPIGTVLSFGSITVTFGEHDGYATAVGNFEQVSRRSSLIRIDEMNERFLTGAYVRAQWLQRLPEFPCETEQEYIEIAPQIGDLAQAIGFINAGLARFPQSEGLLNIAIEKNVEQVAQLLKTQSGTNMKVAGDVVRKATEQARTLLGNEGFVAPIARGSIENAVFELARLHAKAGNAEQAYAFLGDLADLEFTDGARLKLEPDFAALYNDPKFASLVQAMRPRQEPSPDQDYELQEHPEDAVEFEGHWYKAVPEKLNWNQAQARCREMGGYIACIESAEENDFLTRLWPQGHLWLGGRLDANAKWVWLTGKPMAHANWQPGEPNNLSLGTELRIKTNPSGFWFDVPRDDGNILGYVCEWEK